MLETELRRCPADTVVRKTTRPRGPTGVASSRCAGRFHNGPASCWASCVSLPCWAFGGFSPAACRKNESCPIRSLPSPAETLNRDQLQRLWFDNALTRNLLASLRRVVLGFALAAAIGIPLGVLCGCFPWMNSFLAPINVFGRNIPIAALIPLTFALFGIGEFQKIMFIFIAAVAFVMMDTATAVADVSGRYIDTAYTLGASRWQIISKVLVPLAMPRVFNSLRLLFGLAFGYIMLAELVTEGGRCRWLRENHS